MINDQSNIENLWRAFPHTYAQKASYQKWKPYKHLKYVLEQIYPSLLTGGGRFVVSMPPRHGKSETLSKWLPAWYLDNFGDRNVILTSYGDELASSFGRWVRNHFDGNELSNAKLKQDNFAAHRFQLTNGSSMITAGIGGSITGKGGHLLICDDPIKNWEEASSENYRQKVKDWFDTTFYTRQEPGSTIIVIMTRWHHADLAGYLLNEHNDKWQEISLPALAYANDAIGRAENEALCRERYDEKALDNLKNGLPDQHWVSLYQQRPSKIGGEIFKRDWWKYYDEAPKNIIQIAQFWDTAQKPGLTNDYSVCATWGKTHNGYYLLDLFRQKLEAPDLEQAVVQQFNKWKPMAVNIEDKSSGSSIIQYLRRSTTIPVLAYDPKQRDKEQRAIAATPTIRSGNCYLPRTARWLSDFITEHEEFPTSAHDDQVDTTSQMVEYFNNVSTYQPRVRSL